MILARELKKKTMELEDVDGTNYSLCVQNDPQGLNEEAGELKIGERAMTIQTTALLLSRDLET